MVKLEPKSCLDFITEDKSLSKKMTAEEYKNNKFAPENSDESLEKAYAAYKRILEKFNA